MRNLLIFFLGFICFALKSQEIPLGPPESWINIYQETIVALGHVEKIKDPTSKKDKEIFKVIGTGMLFYVNVNNQIIPCLITAKHIFEDPQIKWFPKTLRLRHFNFNTLPLDSYLGVEMKLKEAEKKLWFDHDNSNVDLVCLPMPNLEAQLGIDLSLFPWNSIATIDDYYEGAEILIFGFPGIVESNYHTKALVRKGIVSWIDILNPEENTILIDANIYPGNSGGPVILMPSGIDKYGNFSMGSGPKFLGIVSAKRVNRMLLFDSKGNKIVDGFGDAYTLESVGIGIVEPAKRVKELLSKTKKLLEKK